MMKSNKHFDLMFIAFKVVHILDSVNTQVENIRY